MSSPIAPTTAATGLSVTDEAHAPAAVRNGSASVKKAYASAQGFEEMLMQQLSQSMLQSSGLGGEGGGEGEEGSSGGSSSGEGGMLTSLLPQALTEGVMREGGLGLATQLMSSLDPAAAASAPGASVDSVGGVAA
jgi:Rod binding domain-containing protein